MRFVIGVTGNLNLKEVSNKIAKRIIVLTEDDLIGNLKKNTPVKDGAARAGWNKDNSGLQSRVYNDVKYMKFLNDGTGIYGPKKRKITPTSGGLLRFKWPNAPSSIKPGKDGFYYFRSVKGIKPTKTVEKSVPATTKRINEFAQIAIRENL